MKLPNFLGIGAQKCATTWLAEVIGAHPQLFMAEVKEQDFWSHHYHMGFSWYATAFEAAGSRFCGEISPSYLTCAEAAGRIADKLPDCKLVLALRDPIDRAFSNHLHQVRKRDYRLADTSFEAGLADNPMYLEQSRYGRNLERWRKHFSPERFFIVFQEDMQADPVAEAERLYRFLDVDPAHRSDILNERTHENVGYRNVAIRDGLRFFGRSARRLGLHAIARRAKTAPIVGTLYRSNLQDFRKIIARPTAELRLRLARELESDMKMLCRLLERSDLPWESWRMLKHG